MKYKLKQIIFYINSIIYKTINLAIKMIIPIMVLMICTNVKASVVSRYQCSNTASNNAPCDKTFQASDIWTSATIYRLNNNNYFQNYGQGYVNFSFIAWGYTGTYNLPIYEVDLRTDLNPSTGNLSIFVCDIGTYTQYFDNQHNYTVYSVKCPAQIGQYGIYDIIFKKYSGDETIMIKRSEIMTWTSDESDANAITSNQNAVAQQEISAIQNQTTTITNNANTNAQQIINAINAGDYNTQQAINDITDYDAREGDGDDSRPDDQVVDDTVEAEQDLIEAVQETLDPIQAIVYDLSSFNEAFDWIWDTLQEMINSHHLIFTTVIIMLFIGLSKLILCR